MSVSVPPPTAESTAAASTVGPGWRLNQQLTATVVEGTNGRKNLLINGNLYSPLQHMHLAAGKSLTLIVRSLSPYVELGLLNTSLLPQRSEARQGILLSPGVMQWSGLNLQAEPSSLLRFIGFLAAPSPQQLPPATTALLSSVLERIVPPAALISVTTLEPAMLNASLIRAAGPGNAAASLIGNEMSSLLTQLIRSLPAAGAADQGKAPVDNGLALYQLIAMAGVGSRAQLARELSAEFMQVLNSQELDRDYLELYERRWVFELPINYQGALSAVSARFFEERSNKKSRRKSPGWVAEFEFELPGMGELRVELIIEDLTVSVDIVSSNPDALRQMEACQNTLRDKLEPLGLQLSAVTCRFSDSTKARQSRPEGKKSSGNVESVPLQNFLMLENSRELDPAAGIPEFLYCAMAALFGYLFTVENALS